MAGRNGNHQDDAQEEVIEDNEEREGEEGDENEQDEKDDRGDDADPAVNKDTLKKVAGAGKGDKKDESEEGEEEEHADDESESDKAPKVVPRARLNQEIERRKALEEENARLKKAAGDKEAEEAEEEEETGYDFDAKEEEYLKLVSEGELKAAAALRREINQALKEEAKAEATVEAVQAVSGAAKKEAFDKEVAAVLKEYPWLDDKDKKNADHEAIEEVVEWRNFYITQKGMAPAEALRKAAERVAKSRDEDEAEESAEEEDGKEKAKEAGEERTKTAIKKGAETASKQPPPTKGKGNRSSEEQQLNVEDMDDDAFDKLPAAEKKRLRGD